MVSTTGALLPERTHQIFQNSITIQGGVGTLAGGNIGTLINVTTVRPGDFESLRTFLLGAGIPAADVTQLETAIAREPGIRSIEAGRETAGWWTKVRQKVASGALTLGSAISLELVKQGVDAFFQQ